MNHLTQSGRVLRMKHITRDYVRSHRDTLFVFGDNMARNGHGGQAAAMRGEPNSVGIPTKWSPKRTDDAYFSDADLRNSHVTKAICDAFQYLETALHSGRNVVIPTDGLGTGLAELSQRAPKIHNYIEQRIRALSQHDRHTQRHHHTQ